MANKVINSEALKAEVNKLKSAQEFGLIDLESLEDVIESMAPTKTFEFGMSYEVIQMVLVAEACDYVIQGKFEGARALYDMADYFGVTIPKKIEEAKREQQEV